MQQMTLDTARTRPAFFLYITDKKMHNRPAPLYKEKKWKKSEVEEEDLVDHDKNTAYAKEKSREILGSHPKQAALRASFSKIRHQAR